MGKVVDAETGEPLIGANAVLEGTPLGAASDLRGEFRISNIVPGSYTVIVSMVSFARQRITDVHVGPGETVSLSILLKPEAVEFEEVVVEARAVLSYEAALLTRQRQASAISDGVSAELIRRTPDATSGDALRRVSGVALVDNKFIYVRGTPERYSNAMLNGSTVSSAEPDKKSFSFDLIPSNLLENMIITKSFTPDLPGDFAGGVVSMNTIDFPPVMTIRVGLSASYHTGSTFRGFLASSGGGLDYLAADDGSRQIPAGFPDNLGQQQYTASELHDFARSLNNNWSPRRRTAPLNSSYSLSIGDGATLFGQNFGFVTSFSYRTNFETSTIERYEYEASGEPRFEYTGDRSVHSVTLGGIANLSYKFNDFHKIGFKNTYSRSADDEVTEFGGFQYTDAGTEQRHTAIRYVSRAVYSGQVVGEHFVPVLGGAHLEWRTSHSSSHRDEPDYRRVVYFLGDDGIYRASLGFQANLKNGGRYFSDLHDLANGYGVNISIPVGPAKAKFGGQVDTK
ncbi:MAG: carboxypeptidase-like regulatory domain-containing protein, partial [Bacteroidota bacterium]